MKEKIRNISEEWQRKAEEDLHFAEASLREFNNFYGQICILCHDAVEKFLKAFIISQGRIYPRTHDLVVLVDRCSRISLEFKLYKDGCKTLNRYYVPLKYPSHYPSPKRIQAKQAVEIASEIAKLVREKIYHAK